MNNTNISAEIYVTIQANKTDVWDALINPAKVKAWFFDTTLTTTWEPGTPVIFSGEWQGQPYEEKGTVLIYKHEQMLQYTYFSSMGKKEDSPENYQEITYRVGGDDGNITVTVIQENIPGLKEREDCIKNWEQLLENLKKLLEANELI